MRSFTPAPSPLGVSSLHSGGVMPRVPAFALRGLRRAGARFLGVAMKRDATAELFFRGDRNLRRPGEPFLLRLVVQEEHGAGLGARRAGRRGEFDAAGDEGAQRLELHVEALDDAAADVEPAYVPEGRAFAHEVREARIDHAVAVGEARIR